MGRDAPDRGCPELEGGCVMGWGGGCNWGSPEKCELRTDFLNQGREGGRLREEPACVSGQSSGPLLH